MAEEAIDCLDRSVRVADAQRANPLTKKVPVVGPLLGWIVSPLAARLPYASAERRREVDEGTACGALATFYRGALRCLSGHYVAGGVDKGGFSVRPFTTASLWRSELSILGERDAVTLSTR